MIFFMPLLLDKWTDGRMERQTDGQNRRTDGPAHFSVRCHIEYIHSSKLQEFGGMKPTQPRVLRNGMSPTFGANHGAGGETL